MKEEPTCEKCREAVKSERQQKFKNDMEEAGYEVKEYCGRFYYHGWSVRCEIDEKQDVIRATSVRLQSDNMGLGVICIVKPSVADLGVKQLLLSNSCQKWLNSSKFWGLFLWI